MKKAEDKVALITGGSSGIGLATAQLLYQEGAKIIIVGRDPKKLAAAASLISPTHTDRILIISADTSGLTGITTIIQQVTSTFGRIDILFANAGISDAPELFDTDELVYDRMMNTNVKSIFFLFTKCFPLLSDNASVIFTSSIAHLKGRPGDPLYAATKAAVRGLGRTFAMNEETLKKKIRVNVISPGAIATPLTDQDTPEMQSAIDEFIQQAVPMQRWGQPEEIAKAVLFLASDDSSYMTGGDLIIDGGWAQV